MVTDLDSTNGTWAVRGDQRRQLRPLACTSLEVGESLQLGNDPQRRNARVEVCVEGDAP